MIDSRPQTGFIYDGVHKNNLKSDPTKFGVNV